MSWCDPTDRPDTAPPTFGRGARRLAAAVIESAFHDLQYPPETSMARNARRWLLEDDRGPYGFVGLCEALDLDVGALRAWARGIVPDTTHRRLIPRHVVVR